MQGLYYICARTALHHILYRSKCKHAMLLDMKIGGQLHCGKKYSVETVHMCACTAEPMSM